MPALAGGLSPLWWLHCQDLSLWCGPWSRLDLAGNCHVAERRALAVLLRTCTRAYVPALLSWEAIAAGINGVAFRARCTRDRYAGERCASTRMDTACYSCFIATGGCCATLRSYLNFDHNCQLYAQHQFVLQP